MCRSPQAARRGVMHTISKSCQFTVFKSFTAFENSPRLVSQCGSRYSIYNSRIAHTKFMIFSILRVGPYPRVARSCRRLATIYIHKISARACITYFTLPPAMSVSGVASELRVDESNSLSRRSIFPDVPEILQHV